MVQPRDYIFIKWGMGDYSKLYKKNNDYNDKRNLSISILELNLHRRRSM